MGFFLILGSGMRRIRKAPRRIRDFKKEGYGPEIVRADSQGGPGLPQVKLKYFKYHQYLDNKLDKIIISKRKVVLMINSLNF